MTTPAGATPNTDGEVLNLLAAIAGPLPGLVWLLGEFVKECDAGKIQGDVLGQFLDFAGPLALGLARIIERHEDVFDPTRSQAVKDSISSLEQQLGEVQRLVRLLCDRPEPCLPKMFCQRMSELRLSPRP